MAFVSILYCIVDEILLRFACRAEEGDIFLLFIYIYLHNRQPGSRLCLWVYLAKVNVVLRARRLFAFSQIEKQFYTHSTNVLSCSKRLLYYMEKTENWNYAIIFFFE